jgi:hypothetical protein
MQQFRWRDVFGRWQEEDQFYSVGTIWRKRQYTFVFDTTFVANLGKVKLRQGHSNENVIITLELGRRISHKYPITAFVRSESIFNIGADSSPGYAGFNYRIFGGFRTEISKPAIFPVKLKES